VEDDVAGAVALARVEGLHVGGAGHLAADARKKLPAAGGLTLVALVALLLTNGGIVPDVLALLIGGGAGLAAVNGLQGARRRLANPQQP
jgi:hypothetical protein